MSAMSVSAQKLTMQESSKTECTLLLQGRRDVLHALGATLHTSELCLLHDRQGAVGQQSPLLCASAAWPLTAGAVKSSQ